ncbi:hypothetical protein EG329_008895 [Mollisiaceae sp. DMI_Dod_QoI]|nr:hypothetical protein EG329_008895 [Helotiales sp. DMI_Dod_QoI]
MATPRLNASIVAPKNPNPPGFVQEKQLTLFVTIQVAPSNIEKFKEAHRPVWKACSEEPECLLFDVFQDLESPGRFRFVEVWSKGREWFETVCVHLRGGELQQEKLMECVGQEQMTKPYYKTLWEKSKPLWIVDIKMEYYEREGEGSFWSNEYLAGGTKMEKTQVIA